jgi:hypothetical protein
VKIWQISPIEFGAISAIKNPAVGTSGVAHSPPKPKQRGYIDSSTSAGQVKRGATISALD